MQDSMKFNLSRPAYLQVTDHICERILQQRWKEGGKLPSIRELAIRLKATPNTVARAYRWLCLREIIDNRHKDGFYVSPNGIGIVLSIRRGEFLFSNKNL